MSREERIAALFVAGLGSLIPASCTTTIGAGWLEVSIDGEAWVYIGLIPGDDAALAFSVLSTIQDVIVRSSGRPWPTASAPTQLPYPEAKVRQGQLEAWFGPESAPALILPLIDLATV